MSRTANPLTKKQSAILAAVAAYATTPIDHDDPMHKIKNIADKMLQRIDENISNTEFDDFIATLTNSGMITMTNGVPVLTMLLAEIPPLRFKNDEQRAHFLGTDVLFLQNDEINDHAYIIEFNCDGKGGKRLPSGEITNKTLAKLTQELRKEHGIVKGDSSGVNNWVISEQHHPNMPNKKNDRKLRNYLRWLDEQDPTRRQTMVS